MRLGRLPHHPEAVDAAPKLAARMERVPLLTRCDRSAKLYEPLLGGNQKYPDCTAVAIANSALGFAAADGGIVAIEDAAIEGFYAATIGVPVADIGQTDGAVLLDAMRRQCAHGMLDKSGQVLLTGPFGTIEPTDRRLLAAATAILGPIILGVDLTMAEQQPGVWDLARPGADQPWGGHALVLWDFAGIGDEDQMRLATWGELQVATWRWLYAQCREAYAVVWPDLLGPSGKQWSGLDRLGLAADVTAWCAS